MACLLPAARWENYNRPGLWSATENIADNTIVLTWGDGLAVYPASNVYYLIYYGSSRDTLYDEPRFITQETTVAIPKSILNLSSYIGVRVAQLGATEVFNSTNLVEVNTDVYSFPSPVSLRLDLNPGDGYVAVDSTSGYPLEDGYLQLDSEIISYSNVVTYAGGPAFQIANRDPYGCDEETLHIADGYTEVSLYRGVENLNENSFRPQQSCGLSRPTWINPVKFGITNADDLGIGQAISLEWASASAPLGFSRIYYNVYRSKALRSLFDSQPLGVSTEESAIDPWVQPGDGYYYLVRATYFIEDLSIGELTTISDRFYSYPDPVQVDEVDGYLQIDQTGSFRISASTDGFPSSGLLVIGSEVISYSAKTADTFTIDRRDVFEVIGPSEHPNGTDVFLFRGIEDTNTVFYRTTPTWDLGREVPRIYPPTPGDGYDGYQYLQDPDGYRSIPVDNINENNQYMEENNRDFESQDYCGFRAETFEPLYSGDRCGTFHGGVQMRTIPGLNDGKPVPVGSGMDLFEVNLQRQEFLLGLTGEPVVLLRRKWTGKTCPRLSLRHEHPHDRCGLCFGTGFFGGYTRYANPRTIRPGELNPNGFLQVRFDPYIENIELTDRGLSQQAININAWTLAIPNIKDRDIIVGYISDNETGYILEDFRYEVLSVQRNKITMGKEGAQKLVLRRLDKTEQIYSFAVPLV